MYRIRRIAANGFTRTDVVTNIEEYKEAVQMKNELRYFVPGTTLVIEEMV